LQCPVPTINVSGDQVMPDLFFYRDPEEVERERAANEAEVTASKQQDFAAPPSKEEWGGDQQGPASDWAIEAVVDGVGGVPPGVPVTDPVVPVPVPTAMPTYQVTNHVSNVIFVLILSSFR